MTREERRQAAQHAIARAILATPEGLTRRDWTQDLYLALCHAFAGMDAPPDRQPGPGDWKVPARPGSTHAAHSAPKDDEH